MLENTPGGTFEQSGKPGSIVRTSGEELTAQLDTGIQSYDNVETENGPKIKFVDETQISLTEHTLVEITEYVYDPDPSKSKMVMNFVFRPPICYRWFRFVPEKIYKLKHLQQL